MSKLLKFYYKSFIRIKGFVLIFVTVIITIIPIYSSWESTIQIKHIVPFACILCIIISVIIDASFVMWKKHVTLPRVIQGMESPALFKDTNTILLILEESPLFSNDLTVSIYEMDNDYERFIGLGRVFSIQDNGWIQVLCSKYSKKDDKLWKKASSNNNIVLEKLIVKPGIPYQYSQFAGI